MASTSAPTVLEEWPDADFDLPEGELFHAPSDKEADEEDWDLESNAPQSPPRSSRSANTVGHIVVANFGSSQSQPQIFTIRPPATLSDSSLDDDLDDEGVSTIKVAALPTFVPKRPQSPIDEDFEDAFALPSDLTQLSLAPLSLNHRSSKNSLEWGDKDHTSSSQSSDAYSTLGFADASPSNSASSASLPETETEEEDDDLDGLVLPSALFESAQGSRQLTKILDKKKHAPTTSHQPKLVNRNSEEDFEMGLVIDDDVDLSPSRLLGKQPHGQRTHIRSHTVPTQRTSSLRPPSRANRAKSPLHPPTSSARQLQRIQSSPSPPSRPPTRSQTYQTLSAITPTPSSSASSFLSPKSGSLRGQKSYSGLKPPTPPSTLRSLTRKASLSSLIESSHAQASGSGSSTAGSSKARYEEPTAASRAKSHKYSTSRAQDFKVPPTRPHTPSSNPAALRLTMPTQLRTKIRPALSTVFGATSGSNAQPTPTRATSPLPPRPSSSSSSKSQRISGNPTPPVPKVLRRPKRQRTYGDGTELDGIEDLPTDREKEGRYRVQPKGYGNRIPGASYPSKPSDKGTIRNKGRREGSIGIGEPSGKHPTSSGNALRRATTRIEFPSKQPSSPSEKSGKKKKKRDDGASPQPHAGTKPTLIRNLGNASAPKVVGDMKWNPLSLRWEGNDHVLRDFDAAVGTSTRPALITQLTGSSVGSPIGSFASGARIVGNMIFDPTRMCWISTLPPDEDEPDVFANLADDEEDSDAWETKGGTIRASLRLGSEATTSADSSTSSQMEAPSPSRSHSRTISESGSDRGSRASIFFDVDETFLENCRLAEQRHRTEMKGWMSVLAKQDIFSTSDRSSLYEIRNLATRKY